MKKASEKQPERRSFFSRFRCPVLFVLIAMCTWSGLWYYGAQKAERLTDMVMAVKIDNEPLFTCADRHFEGFPFRLQMTCSSYVLKHGNNGWKISGGALKTGWKVYAPNKAEVETSKELVASRMTDEGEDQFTIQSELMHGTVRLDPIAMTIEATFRAKKPTIISNHPLIARLFGWLKADYLTLSARPNRNENRDLDVAVSGENVESQNWPSVNGSASLTIREALNPALLDGDNPGLVWLKESGKLDAIDGKVKIGQKHLHLTGDLTFDKKGYANGDMALAILNKKPENTEIKANLEAKHDGLNGPLTALQLMGKPISEGELVGAQISLKLKNGQMSAGLFPLVQLPSLITEQ